MGRRRLCAGGIHSVNGAKDAGMELLGLELYEPLVIHANEIRDADGVSNLHYVACNARTSLETLNLPNVRRMSILFADPWDLDKHGNRRLVDDAFAARIADMLPLGGEVYVASDYQELAESIVAKLEGTNKLKRNHGTGFLDARHSPFPFATTERDRLCEQKWKPVWRALLVKND